MWVARICAVGLLSFALTAAADEPRAGSNNGGGDRRAAAADPLSPKQLLQGPSLYETGRIGTLAAPQPVDSAGMAPVAVPDVGAARGEKSIEPVAATVQPPPAEPVGTISAATLDREAADRFTSLEDCRVEVARQERVTPDQVRGRTLTLRWKILPSGAVTDTQVVATSPTDPALMDCAKVVMSAWTFTRPRGGSVAVERNFTFR